MDRLRKVIEITKCFMERPEWSPRELKERIECSRYTVYRTIRMAQLYFHMPLVYNGEKKVWSIDKSDTQLELPYIWFTPREVLVLLSLLEAFRDLPFGMVDGEVSPFKARLEKILESEKGEMGDLLRKIKVIPAAFRNIDKSCIAAACEALSLGRKMEIRYRGRQGDEESVREVSPLQLVRYRDNWYLDAFCHKRESLRTFSIDRILRAAVLSGKAKRVPKREIEEFFSGAYGIFSGKPKAEAVLRFTPGAARWVSCESWHPKQEGRFEPSGHYVLKVPYSDERELVLDIMKWGGGVEVIGPKDLRALVKKKLLEALDNYG